MIYEKKVERNIKKCNIDVKNWVVAKKTELLNYVWNQAVLRNKQVK